MILNIPNNLTLLRIALIPCLILVFYLSDETLSAYQKNLTATLIFLPVPLGRFITPLIF